MLSAKGKTEQGKGDQKYGGKVWNLEYDGQSRLHWEVLFGQRHQGGKTVSYEDLSS